MKRGFTESALNRIRKWEQFPSDTKRLFTSDIGGHEVALLGTGCGSVEYVTQLIESFLDILNFLREVLHCKFSRMHSLRLSNKRVSLHVLAVHLRRGSAMSCCSLGTPSRGPTKLAPAGR